MLTQLLFQGEDEPLEKQIETLFQIQDGRHFFLLEMKKNEESAMVSELFCVGS